MPDNDITPNNTKFITVAKAIELFSTDEYPLDKTRIYYWLEAGHLKRHKFGSGRIAIDQQEVEALVIKMKSVTPA